MSPLKFLPWSSVPLSQASLYENLPAVLDNEQFHWAHSPATVKTFAAEHGAAIRAHLTKSGCVLLRGFPLQGAQDFEDILLDLKIPLSGNYEGGTSHRQAVSAKTFTSTEAAGHFLITPHNEMSYLPYRPTSIAFYCDVAPKKYGETPIFNSKDIAQALPKDLAGKMQRLGIIYRRSSSKKTSRWNVEKTLDQVFGTSDQDKVQNLLDKLQARSHWDGDGDLTFDVHTPAFVRHPQTGHDCMNMVVFNKYAHTMDTSLFKDRWNPVKLTMVNTYMTLVHLRSRCFMRTLWGNGKELSREETRTLLHTAWQHSLLFKWKKGDVLILDNILWGHGRLNVEGPRRILAALGQPYDIASMVQPAAAPM